MLEYFLDYNEQKLRIGEIFVRKGLITKSQLQKALFVQRQTRNKLGTILIEQNLISEQDLAIALLEQWCLNSLIIGLCTTVATLTIPRVVRAEGAAEATITFSGYLAPSVTLVTPTEARGESSSQESVAENSATTTLTIYSNAQREKVTVKTSSDYQTLVVN